MKIIKTVCGLAVASLLFFRAGYAQSCIPVDPNLVGWWTADNTASDELGVNNGTIYNGVTYTVGEVGSAFQFNWTSGGHVRIPDAPSLHITGPMTIDAWIYLNPSSRGRNLPILANWSAVQPPVQCGYSFSVDPSGRPYLAISPSGASDSSHYAMSSGSMPVSQWLHVAGVYDESYIKIYTNGTLAAQTAYSGGVYPAANAIAISGVIGGAPPGGTIAAFDGALDEVGLYSRALADWEIAQIYAAGTAGRCKTATMPTIITQPANQTVFVDSTATFFVAASGRPINYQWRFNSADIPGATNSALVLNDVQAEQAGLYSVILSNELGTVPSDSATLAVITNLGCVSAPSGMAAWWPASGNGADALNQNNGTLQNGLDFAPGEVGQAFHFDGVDDYIYVPASSTLDVGAAGGFTIEFWMRPSNTSIGQCILEWNDGSSSGGGLQIWHSKSGVGSGSVDVNVKGTDGSDHLVSTSANKLNTTNFQHVALAYSKSSGSATIYLNGVAAASGNIGNIRAQTTWPLYIGTRPAGDGAPALFQGLLDEVTMYNRVLASNEIQAIYITGADGKACAAPSIIVQPVNQRGNVGSTVTFSATAKGTQPLSYQWKFNGANLPGATNSSLTIANIQGTNAGNYSLEVSNFLGIAVSSNALLKVNVVFAYANGQPLSTPQATFNNPPVTITLTDAYSGGYIFYTLDGSEPTFSSTLYSGAFTVNTNVILRALGYSVDFFESGELDPIAILFLPKYTLKGGTSGGGAVTLNPNAGTYLNNSVVTITATPASGWTFLQWLGDASGNNTVTNVTVNRNKSVTAVFGTTLTVTAAGGGSVSMNPPGGVYPYGTIVWLSGIPQSGKVFALWGNAASGNVNPLAFGVTNSNPVVSSLFGSVTSGQAALTVVPVGSGRVNVSPPANSYALNASVTITATAASGQKFIGWSGDADGTQNPLPVTVNQNKTIYANFSHDTILSDAGTQSEGFAMTLQGDLGRAFEFDASTNFVDWTSLATLTNAAGTLQFIDTDSTNYPVRVYRAVLLPQ